MKTTLTADELETRLLEQIRNLKDGDALAELYEMINPDSGIKYNEDEQNFTLDSELKSSNSENREEAIEAFCKFAKLDIVAFSFHYQCEFEHGQLWVIEKATGKTYSVVDAKGYDSYDGYDFEVVTIGDDE